MRNLIRKILFEEFHKPRTYIEEVSLSELSLILENEIDCEGGDATVPVDPAKEADVNQAIKNGYNQDDFYYDVKSKKGFVIQPTKHWLQRLDRKKEKNYENNSKYFDPTNTEGVDLIFKLKDEIINRLSKHNWEESRQLCLKLIDYQFNNIEYTNLIKIDKGHHLCTMGKQCYRISLITQLKGPEFVSKNKKYANCRQKVF